MSALLALRPSLSAPPPASCDWTTKLPANLGVMKNDILGDCTCAGFYHALQVWTSITESAMDTESDSNVEALYEQACGYDPKKGGEGDGGVEQDVLTYLMNTGAPVGPGGSARHKIAAFIEVDPRNQNDVKATINDCGVAYIGFEVPSFLMDEAGGVPPVWDIQPFDGAVLGGHCVILAGYDANGVKVISWGEFFTMTWAFFAQYVDEVYALADADWINTQGTSPGGLTLEVLEGQMQALKEA
jgi:hypothetical protein